ncbi:MAG TPA: prepilin-type N-terminal cleavage/methylation domain-containing protein [Acidimicrobiia bacterium]|jgi:general secretion pathway protein G|nr:prepilin-type N-terminal cleavage/methylation domain-containing protein [Acidimicrobiia bacterium]
MHKFLNGRRAGAREQRGFTLVELLVVVLILGVLAAVVVFSVGGISTRGKNAACVTEVREVRTAIEAYKAQSAANAYPAALANLWTAPTKLLQSPITAASPSATAGYVYGGAATGTYDVGAGGTDCPAG